MRCVAGWVSSAGNAAGRIAGATFGGRDGLDIQRDEVVCPSLLGGRGLHRILPLAKIGDYYNIAPVPCTSCRHSLDERRQPAYHS